MIAAARPPLEIAAVILAAGSSRRFGTDNKLLAMVDGAPLLTRAIDAAAEAGISEIVIVTGHDEAAVTAAIDGRGRRFVHNARHLEGIGTSIAAGVAALSPEAAGAMIVQGDMPALDAALIDRLCSAFGEAGGDHIVHPILTDGRQGNPVIWPRRLFPDLLRLTGDRGAKHLLAGAGEAPVTIEVDSRAAAIDIDTPDELAAYIASRTSQPR